MVFYLVEKTFEVGVSDKVQTVVFVYDSYVRMMTDLNEQVEDLVKNCDFDCLKLGRHQARLTNFKRNRLEGAILIEYVIRRTAPIMEDVQTVDRREEVRQNGMD